MAQAGSYAISCCTAGLASGVVTPTAPDYPVVTSYTPPLTTRPISNFGGEPCGGTLFAILARSCNTSFAQMAAENLGPDPMIDAAQAAGLEGVLTRGSVVASDAFFPFPDGMLAAVEAGATAVIQPGGSMNDQAVIDAANQAGVAMVFTGMRHFRH